MFRLDDFQNHIKDLLSKNLIKEAFDYINSIEKELPSSLKSDLLLIKARFHKAEHDHNVNFINKSDYGVERVNIINSVLRCIEPPVDPTPPVPPPKKKLLQGVLAFGFIAILAILIPKIIQPNETDLTVIVHSSKGRTHPILRGQGEVSIDVGSDRKKEPIDSTGQAVFLDLPGSFLGKEAVLGIIHDQPYTVIGNEKTVTLKAGEIIYLETKLEGLESIKGQIFSAKTDDPLDSVRVSIDNAATYTDEFGWFELNIPEKRRSKFVQVFLYKDGYINETLDSIAPHTKQNLMFAMKTK